MLFPLGIWDYIIGGIFIGLGVAFVFATTGLHATASSFFDTTWSYFSGLGHFHKPKYLASRDWRVVLALGLVVGALAFTLFFNDVEFFTTDVQLWRLAVGGALVGFGVRLSRGCTSGHGISGVASLSLTSIYAVVTFLGVGILTALLMEYLGVGV